jgi:hypothetical protein
MEKFPQNLYKEIRPSVEKILESFDDPLFLLQVADNFFCLSTIDENGSQKKTEALSEEELQLFKIFCKHVGKRVIISGVDNVGKSLHITKKGVPQQVEDFDTKDIVDNHLFFSTLFHDLSHSVGQIAKHGNETRVTPVQPFLRERLEFPYNKREHLEDELRGFIFGSFYYPSPFANRSKLHLQKSNDYESFKQNFLSATLRASLDSNREAITEARETSLRKDQYESVNWFDKQQELEEEAEKIAKDIIKNPPEDVIRNLEYLWEHRDNPRVLVDLFFKEIVMYLEKLKHRGDYLVR